MINNPGDRALPDIARLRVARYFTDICSELEPPAEKQARIDKVQALEAKSDQELSELGLLREDIVDHAFQEAHYV